VVALVWCGVVLLFHFAAGAFACESDGSGCAHSRHKNGVYEGMLVSRGNEKWFSTAFSVSFESRRDVLPRETGGFSTDADGHYCIVWAQEEELFVHVAGVAGDGAVTFTDPWQPLNGADPPPDCQTSDQGVPWNRAQDLMSSPEFLALPALAVPAAALLLVALLLEGAPKARLARTAGLVLTAASSGLAVLLWLL
jgi:hypothetical protein